MTQPQTVADISTPSRCDLVLLSWNRKDLLEACVARLLAHTTVPSRLIIIDNGSTEPETLAYLDQLRGTPWVQIDVVKRSENNGIAVAINVGLSRTRAPWICLLNNDILVTEGWLDELIDVAEANPTLGLVNPMSNEFGIRPSHGETIDHVAVRLRASHGRWIENGGCSGFCVLLARHTLERVGGWDESFPCYFEDADFCMRVRAAGLNCAIAEGVYVYHLGSATLKQNPLRTALFQKGEEHFYRKWPIERPQRIAWALSTTSQLPLDTIRERIRQLANTGHKIWVFHTPPMQEAIPRHLQVVSHRLPTWCFSIGLCWKILTKKKRFHRVIMLKQSDGHLLRSVGRWMGMNVESTMPSNLGEASGGDVWSSAADRATRAPS